MKNNTPAPVYLVGSGPGDPDLMTVKAMRLIESADVVVYDRLVSQQILDLIPAGVSRIFVGKAAKNHHMVQDEINQLLVRLALAGRKVVRLKGGDPFIFGRGSEEAEILAQNGVPFEAVPGITAAQGCASEFDIPLTHRGVATGVRYLTGHCRNDDPLNFDWDSLADPDTTLVVYMGLQNLPMISAELIKAGLDPETPAAAIASGTTPDQDICRSTLENIARDAIAAELSAPTLIIIGHVINVLAKPVELRPANSQLSRH